MLLKFLTAIFLLVSVAHAETPEKSECTQNDSFHEWVGINALVTIHHHSVTRVYKTNNGPVSNPNVYEISGKVWTFDWNGVVPIPDGECDILPHDINGSGADAVMYTNCGNYRIYITGEYIPVTEPVQGKMFTLIIDVDELRARGRMTGPDKFYKPLCIVEEQTIDHPIP